MRGQQMTKYLVTAMSVLGLLYVLELQQTQPQIGNILTGVLVVLWLGAAIQEAWKNR
jgi:hypothetical protein